MRVSWLTAIVMVCLVVSIAPGSVWAFGDPQDQIDAYLTEVDLGLSSEEELALKRRLVAEGVFDRLRTGRQEALTGEERTACRYLTRPVRARDEANPQGQRPIIIASLPKRLSLGEFRAALSHHGLAVLHEWEGVADEHFVLEGVPGMDAPEVARTLKDEMISSDGKSTCFSGGHFDCQASLFLLDAKRKPGSPPIYISKNKVGVYFSRPVTARELGVLAEEEKLILLDPRVNFTSIDTAWTTAEAAFFVGDSATVGEVVDRLYARPEVRDAHPNGWITLDAFIPERLTPSDPNYTSIPSSSQWYFLQNRSSSGANSNDDDSRDFDVDAPEGWQLETGGAGTIVAIIDAGFRIDHPDLQDRWWVNPGENPNNGLDDDNNGFVNDVHGVNLADSTSAIPRHYHGTMTAGLVGAATSTSGGDNGAGTNWGCRLMALRFDDTLDAILLNRQVRVGIMYARTMGAKVVSMSFGWPQFDAALRDTIATAFASGIVLVAGVGNQHNDPSDDPHYPGDYPGVVEVAGSADDNRRFYTTPTYGSGWGQGVDGPDLCAPAEDMYVLCDDSLSGSPCYGQDWTDGVAASGTSLATPIVAGLAALVKDRYPSLAGDANAVVRILKGAVDDVHGRVTDEQNASSDTCAGPDDLGAGRVNFFKALAPPRLQTVILTQDGSTRFNEGDLNGNSIFNWMDEDIDGDSYANSDDNNDDGDEFMDGPDVDLDQDGAWDEADTNYVLRQEIEPGDLDVWVLFNESMLVDNYGGVDPSVKLILPDGSELVFASVGSGNDDWDTQWVANDRWHGRVTVTGDDIAKMYGDLRLEISGSADMAGEALDWDLETPGAQGYVYPLHVPGFVASASDPNAGVEKNTTALGQGTWPMAWGVVDVVGRGFNTDASDPLSVQSMQVTIERGYDNQTVVSGAPMAQTGRDFRYAWDTVAD